MAISPEAIQFDPNSTSFPALTKAVCSKDIKRIEELLSTFPITRQQILHTRTQWNMFMERLPTEKKDKLPSEQELIQIITLLSDYSTKVKNAEKHKLLVHHYSAIVGEVAASWEHDSLKKDESKKQEEGNKLPKNKD